MKSSFILVPACVVAVTDGSGEATVQVKVPGTFGLDADDNFVENPFEPSQDSIPCGRFLDHAEIWADTHDIGDRITDLVLKDVDGVIPEEMRSHFPSYPILTKFYDAEVEETANIKQGLFLNGLSSLRVASLGSIPNFVPGGLYICGTFKSSAIGKTVRCNFFWGKNA